MQRPVHGWILYSQHQSELKEDDHGVNRLLEAAQTRNIHLEVHRPDSFELIVSKNSEGSVLIQGKQRQLPDFVIPRTGSNTTYFTLAVLRQLERFNVYACNNSKAIETVKDKLFLHQKLAHSNLPTPKTMLLKFPVDLELVKKEIGFPLVVKNIVGTHGKGIYLCENPDKFNDLVDLLYSNNEKMNIILQEFVSFSKGTDLRVFVVGGKVLGCMKRTAKSGFKANFSIGGTVSEYPICPELEWLATETTRIVGLDIAGIDLLFDKTGYKILEANSAPGFKGMEQVTGKIIAEQILDYVSLKLTGYIGE